jgi:hypothetical protein
MKTFSLIITFLFLTVFDLPRLIKEKKKKEIFIYAAFMGAAFLISELHVLRWHLWSPDRIITDIVRLFIH